MYLSGRGLSMAKRKPGRPRTNQRQWKAIRFPIEESDFERAKAHARRKRMPLTVYLRSALAGQLEADDAALAKLEN